LSDSPFLSQGSISQNPGPTFPTSTLTSMLSQKVKALEKSTTGKEKDRKDEMDDLRDQLEKAVIDIGKLSKENIELKKRLDEVSRTTLISYS
jgi:hypothetical protein